MKRKIIGYVFYLLSVIFILSIIGQIISLSIGRTSFKITSVFSILLSIFLIYIFLKYAREWTKPKVIEEIHKIGNNDLE